jgi:putative 4-alpha-glucanotransferase
MSIDEELRLADPNAERINVPSNPKHYWRYRMHVSIEDLMKNTSFNEQITDLINQAGR